jgi:DNA-binding LytR/AlgR family response regulator
MIVDDEPPARRVLEKFGAQSPELDIVASCASADEARSILQLEDIDLIFLDIRMPGESGLDLVRALENPPFIVFVTAFPEHAVEGFELEAVDYLVKPFSEARFRKAIEKVVYLARVEREVNEAETKAVVMIKSDKKLYRIPCREILYLESVGDYVKVFSTRTKPLLPKTTLKGMLEALPAQKFMQIHRSYAIAIEAIQYLEGNQVCVNGTLLPVSDTFRQALTERLDLDQKKK